MSFDALEAYRRCDPATDRIDDLGVFDPMLRRATPDERVLYYGSAGGVVRRFPLDHDELADLARRRVQRDFTEAECLRFAIADECGDRAVDDGS